MRMRPGDDEAFVVAGQENVTERPYLLPGRWSRRAARRPSPSRRRRCGSGGRLCRAERRGQELPDVPEGGGASAVGVPSPVAGMRLALDRAPACARIRRSIPWAAPDHFGCRYLALRLILRTATPFSCDVSMAPANWSLSCSTAWTRIDLSPVPHVLVGGGGYAVLGERHGVTVVRQHSAALPLRCDGRSVSAPYVWDREPFSGQHPALASAGCGRRPLHESRGLPCLWRSASVSGTTAPSRRSWGAAGMGRREPTGTKAVHTRTLAWSRPRGVRFPSHP